MKAMKGRGGERQGGRGGRRPYLLLASTPLLPLLLLVAAGCARLNATAPARTLRFSNKTDVQSLDPAISYDTLSWPLVRLLYNGLVDYDDNLQPQPWMAESWEVSADKSRYRFRLRRGIEFSNGRELVAGDCVFTLTRILDPKTRSPGEGFFRNIKGAQEFQDGKAKTVRGLRAPERHVFEVELAKPDISFLAVMSLPFTYVVAKEAVAKFGSDFYRNPVGTGPMRLVEWLRGSRLVMERNPRYWDRARYPKTDRLEMMIGGDDMLRLMMFERGELDFYDPIPSPDFQRISQNPKWRPCVSRVTQLAIMYLAMNCELPPFNNKKVRQAMNYAVDREAVLRAVNGRGVPATGVLPPRMPGRDERLRGYGYDPARARRLLAEAGYTNGFNVTLWTRTELEHEQRMAEMLVSQFKAIGVHVELSAVPFPVWDEAVSRRRNVAFSYAGWFMDYPDPYDFLDVLLNGEKIVDLHCNNYAFYNNPTVNALLNRAAGETNPQRRLHLYGQADALVVDDAPWVFLYYPIFYTLRSPRVTGYSMHLIWPYRFERYGVEER